MCDVTYAHKQYCTCSHCKHKKGSEIDANMGLKMVNN